MASLALARLARAQQHRTVWCSRDQLLALRSAGAVATVPAHIPDELRRTYHGRRSRLRRAEARRDWRRYKPVLPSIIMGNTNLPIFKQKECCVRRRYSDFEWLKNELDRDSKILVPPLPGKALTRQLPFRGDEGIFEESFIEERRESLELFINRIAGHPLAQTERCLHVFLQDETIDRSYIPGKIRP